jgi:hypothetical protein
MDLILHDLFPDSLASAIEKNLSGWVPVFGRMGEVHLDNPPGVRRAITASPFALFNSVMEARLEPEQVDTAVQTILVDARRRGVPLL